MKKVKVLEPFKFMGIERTPGQIMTLPDLRAIHLTDEGHAALQTYREAMQSVLNELLGEQEI